MRKLFSFIVATTVVTVGQTHAATLGFVGAIDLEIGNLPPIPAAGLGTATVSGVDLTNLSFPGGAFNEALVSIPVTDPAAAPIVGVLGKGVQNGAGTFSGGPFPAIGGKMALQGSAIVCLLGSALGCTAPVSLGGPAANLVVPFTMNGTRGVGLGDAPIFVPPKAGVHVTVQGDPWTAGTAGIGTGMGTVKVLGFLHGPASGGAATAGQASGVVQLVTPILVSTSIGGISLVPTFGILNIHFTTVPEPGTLLLLTSGVLGLAMLGRRRMRK